MTKSVIEVHNVSKAYQLGKIGTGTIASDLQRWYTTTILRKEDPYLKIGETNDRTTKGNSNIVWSLKDVNFSINQGEAVGIIGRNGAGKSTLLKILSRVTTPTTGKIRIKGRVASLLEVGTGFHPELTGRENIFLNGAILGMRKHEITRKLDEIIDFSGVERYIDTPVKRYSSGMYVRLAFAVAAHLESEILIVDEVLAVGDAEFQKKCLGKMGEVSKGDGRTVLFVSHNLSAVTSLCQSGIVLQNGSIHYVGDAQTAIQKYVQQNSNREAFVSFDDQQAPGNAFSKLKAVSVSSSDKSSDLKIGNDIQLHFDLNLNNDILNDVLDLTFHLKDELGQLVFVGSTARSGNCKGQFRGKASCTVPKNLMNTGIYTISQLLVVRNRGEVLTEFTDMIQFELTEDTEQAFGWQGQKQGVVKPLLDWQLITP